MVWVAAFALCGAAWLLAGTVATARETLVVGAGVLLATALVVAVVWSVAPPRPAAALAPSLRFLTGLHGVRDAVPACLAWGSGATWVLQVVVVVLLVGAAAADVVPAIAGVVGVPLGVLACLAGAGLSALRGDPEPVRAALRLLSAALGCLVLAALVVRLLHAVSLAALC